MSGGPIRLRPHLDPGGGSRIAIEAENDGTAANRARRRFPAATADRAAIAPADELPILDALATAKVRGTGRVAYASNAVFLLELDAPDPILEGQPMRAIYKPARGERPLWDFPRHTLHYRERATYLLDRALGFKLIPPTALRDDPIGPGSAQLLIHVPEGGMRADAQALGAAEALEATLRRLAVLDVLANNADRKRAHVLVDADGRLWGIDNALTFLPYPRQRTVLMDLGGEALEPGDAEMLGAFAADASRRSALRASAHRLLSRDEVRALDGRIDELAADPVYPVLDDWDGRPFEWW